MVQFAPLPSFEVAQLINVQELYGDFARFTFDDWGGGSASFIRQAAFKFIKYAEDAEIPGPYVLNSALLDVADYRFGIDNRLMLFEPLVSDRRNLILPSIYLEAIAGVNREKIVRDALDVLWQPFGLPACTIYTNEGVWAPR